MSTITSLPQIWRGLEFQTEDIDVYAPKPASLLAAEVATAQIPPGSRVLDACTGSGVIGIAIASLVPGAEVTVSDVNEKSLAEARKNAARNGTVVRTVVSDFYAAFDDDAFDFVTVHPPAVPYPPDTDWGLSAGMRIATDGGSDGSHLVSRSILEAHRVIRPGGRLLLLLPHWSNVQTAYGHLRQHYEGVRELARRQVEFFPAREGVSRPRLINHLRALAAAGLIEMTFDAEVPQSWVSVVEATVVKAPAN